MNNRILQKEIEKRQLNVFRELYSMFPNGQVIPGEEPDFTVCTADTLGIELTTLFWGTPDGKMPRQAQESVRYMICQKARKLYTARKLPLVHVSVHFNENYTFKKRMIDPLATRIVDFVEKKIPNINEKYEESYDWDNRSYFPEEVLLIAIFRLEELTRSYFSAPDGGFIPNCTIADIQGALANKDSKYDRYRQTCVTVWLLLNINDRGISSTFDMPDTTANATYTCKFEKVFVVQHREKKLFELNIG